MLFFIPGRPGYPTLFYTFKYISCYSLSILSGDLTVDEVHLNTSHVILYRFCHTTYFTYRQFKYISCYSLSGVRRELLLLICAFKYISCYSLSLVLLLPRFSHHHLNTSHVILYLQARNCIHDCYLFKYISCYSLSTRECHTLCSLLPI